MLGKKHDRNKVLALLGINLTKVILNSPVWEEREEVL